MKEEKKRIDRTEEELTKEERKKFNRVLAEKGVVAGGATGTLGAAMLALGRNNEKVLKDRKRKSIWVPKGDNPKATAQILKAAGIASLAIGLPVAGISAYKHYKYKKEDKKNDNKA